MADSIYVGKIPAIKGFYVYRFWSLTTDREPDTCLYVGCCTDPKRIRQNFSKSWIPEYVGIDVASFGTHAEMLAEKRAQIKKLQPPYYRENKSPGNASYCQFGRCEVR
jgi:hypothetical protein